MLYLPRVKDRGRMCMCEVCTMSAAAKVVLCTVEIPVSSGRVVKASVVFFGRNTSIGNFLRLLGEVE